MDWRRVESLSSELPLLLYLASRGASSRWVTLSTKALGLILGFSQQSASRKLQKLEREGLIERVVSRRGEKVKLTSEGLNLVREVYYSLAFSLQPGVEATIDFEGRVFTGLGEGRYYMSLEGYVAQIVEKLGFKPYPGTLNLRLASKEDVLNRVKLEDHPSIILSGFSDGKRTYGSVRAYIASINGYKPAAVIIPSRTIYKVDVLEVIAPVNLREHLRIRDGDLVKVRVYLQ